MEVTPDQLCDDILQFLQRFRPACAELAEQQGLTPVQMAVLHTIDRYGELPMGKMADMLHCDASNVTGIVDRLVAHGLIERRECPNDRRAKALQLTDKGRQVAAVVKSKLPECLGCSRLSADERATLQALIAKMTA